jgi:L-alanine-DL-glutamate epimerase-like enolase superfamily enzyme
MRRLPREQFARRAAIDAALHDLCGKLPASRSGACSGCGARPADLVDDLARRPDEMARRRAGVASGRFKRLKLKIGGRDGLDVERVRAVEAVSDVPLQVDVNEYWTLDEALDALPQLHDLGVEYCEQPLRRGDEDG